MTSPDPDAYPEAEVVALTDALRRALDACCEPHEVSPGIYTGINLPELLADALQRLAAERGGEALTAQRPGCWEADHLRKLAGVASPWSWAELELDESS